jgi:hypothetical protein
MAAATQLKNELSYRGTIAEPGQQIWYKLDAVDGERAIVNLWGRTRSCPVRATLLDARGRGLGEIVSSTSEIQPFIVYFPANPVSATYYLRIDLPRASCAGAGYVFTLVAPEQPQPPAECQAASNGEPRFCTLASKAEAVSAYIANTCKVAARNYRRAASVLAEERRRVGIGTRRRLESAVSAARRGVRLDCNP